MVNLVIYFVGKEKGPEVGIYVHFWTMAISLAVWSEAWKGQDWKAGDMEVLVGTWMNVQGWAVHVKSVCRMSAASMEEANSRRQQDSTR